MDDDSDLVSGWKEVGKVAGTLVFGLLAIGGVIVAVNVAKQKEAAPQIRTALTAEFIGECLYPEKPYKVQVTNTSSEEVGRWIVSLRVNDRGHSTRYEGAPFASDFILAPRTPHIVCIDFGQTGMVYGNGGEVVPAQTILDPVISAHASVD